MSAPNELETLLDRANAAIQAQKPEEAARILEDLIARAPARPEPYVNLGHLRQNQGDLQSAAALYKKALAVAPETALAHLNLGTLHVLVGNEAAAAASFESAIKFRPDLLPAYFNLAGVRERQERPDDALRLLDAILEQAPQDIPASLAKVPLLFAKGRLPEAWSFYSRRHRIFWGEGRALPARPWRGESVAGKHVLLSYEQGLGEQIMFASLVPEILATARAVTIECEPRLVALLARSFPPARVVPWREQWDTAVRDLDIELAAPMGDPGQWLRKDFAQFPRHTGYLKVDEALKSNLRARYETLAKGRKIVGFSWQSAAASFGRDKSVPFAALGPLWQRDDVLWINLQYGAAAAEAASIAPERLFTDTSVDAMGDMDGPAAQIAALDAVVTVSNTTAHLSGALGKPTWLMLPKVKIRHWYWFPERPENPWYPSVRSLIQAVDGQWDDVIAGVRALKLT